MTYWKPAQESGGKMKRKNITSFTRQHFLFNMTIWEELANNLCSFRVSLIVLCVNERGMQRTESGSRPMPEWCFCPVSSKGGRMEVSVQDTEIRWETKIKETLKGKVKGERKAAQDGRINRRKRE